ncbi:MAG: DUF3089 domain-containing protein [Microthrixaceae bacterium]
MRSNLRPTRSLLLTTLFCTICLLFGACSTDDDAAGDDATEPPTSSNEGNSGDGDNTAGEDSEAETTTVPTASEVYADAANWLCRPDVDGDACDIDLDATLVAADGTQTVEPFVAATDAPVDCIYYYPTISTDPGPNADRVPDGPEQGIVANQFARLAEVCNLYAPMYRQVPLAALFGDSEEDDGPTTTLGPDDPDNPRNIAYSDVRESFLHYLAEDNDGRPFVLVGHSQGSGHLARLIAEEIDGNDELTEQMLSAMLIGSGVVVDGSVEGGIESIGACESVTDTGCIVSYATFYDSEPPGEDSRFGRPRQGDGRVVCTNPAALGGGAANLSSYFQSGFAEGTPEVSTPWVHFTELVEGECLSNDDFDWLEVRVAEGEAFPPDLGGRVGPGWGTHLADVNFTMGDLVELVRTQSGQG